MKVISDNITGTTIRNEACISEDSDKDGNPIDLTHIFKQSKQIVYKTPLTLSQTNQEE